MSDLTERFDNAILPYLQGLEKRIGLRGILKQIVNTRSSLNSKLAKAILEQDSLYERKDLIYEIASYAIHSRLSGAVLGFQKDEAIDKLGVPNLVRTLGGNAPNYLYFTEPGQEEIKINRRYSIYVSKN